MYKIIKRLHFCYGHRLLDYDGKCSRPHGHNGVVEVELKGELDDRGMVVDFAEIKKKLKGCLDELDHRMLLREDDPLVEAMRAIGEEPVVMADNPTAENIACRIFRAGKELDLPVTAVRVWETPDSCAEYRE